MPHHYHGPLLHERSLSRLRERFYAMPRRDPSPDAGAIGSSSEWGRPAQQENIFFRGAARNVHQNIIQQNINLAPHVRGVRRRGSRPVLLAANDDYDDQWNYERTHEHTDRHERCIHGYHPASACSLCARDQRGGPRSLHADENRRYLGYYEEDETYVTDKVIEYAQKEREAKKWQQQAKEAREREFALAQRNEFFARQDYVPPSRSMHRATEDIRRELKQCDDDLKRCYEEAARDAQFRGRVVELENARRKHEEAEKAKNKPMKSILVKKKLRFDFI